MALSRGKPFWYDELHTFYICRLPTLADSLRAVRDGADLNPPFLFLFTRASHQIFGTSEVATRLPSTFGFLLFQISLFRFIARRTSNAVAITAISFPLVTGAHAYAYEARPYGLLLGFCALSAWMWQRLVDENLPGSRFWRHLALALALSCAVLTHTLAVLLFAPFCLAELLRNFRNCKVDWPVWASMLIPPLTLVATVYPPLMRSQGKALTNIAMLRPEWASIPDFYRFLLEPAFFPLIAAILLVSLWRPRQAALAPSAPPAFPPHEFVLASALAMLPAFIVIFCALFTGIFASRYGLCGVIGLTVLFAMFLARSLNNEPRKCLLLAAVFVGFFGAPFFGVPALSKPATTLAPAAQLDKVEPRLPFVVANGLRFLVTEYYADDALAKRLVYVYDAQSAVRYTGANPFDVAYPATWKRYPMRGRVVEYSAFLKENPEFLLFSNHGAPFEWLPRKLIDDGHAPQAVAVIPEGVLYKVSLSPRPDPR